MDAVIALLILGFIAGIIALVLVHLSSSKNRTDMMSKLIKNKKFIDSLRQKGFEIVETTNASEVERYGIKRIGESMAYAPTIDILIPDITYSDTDLDELFWVCIMNSDEPIFPPDYKIIE
jgi:hypothetical protein